MFRWGTAKGQPVELARRRVPEFVGQAPALREQARLDKLVDDPPVFLPSGEAVGEGEEIGLAVLVLDRGGNAVEAPVVVQRPQEGLLRQVVAGSPPVVVEGGGVAVHLVHRAIGHVVGQEVGAVGIDELMGQIAGHCQQPFVPGVRVDGAHQTQDQEGGGTAAGDGQIPVRQERVPVLERGLQRPFVAGHVVFEEEVGHVHAGDAVAQGVAAPAPRDGPVDVALHGEAARVAVAGVPVVHLPVGGMLVEPGCPFVVAAVVGACEEIPGVPPHAVLDQAGDAVVVRIPASVAPDIPQIGVRAPGDDAGHGEDLVGEHQAVPEVGDHPLLGGKARRIMGMERPGQRSARAQVSRLRQHQHRTADRVGLARGDGGIEVARVRH